MRYAIGDIHGEYDKLRQLIDILDKDATEYIFLGDYIDKGEESDKVIEYLAELTKFAKCIFLMGDHEFMWQQYLLTERDEYWSFIANYGGIKTIENHIDTLDLLAFISRLLPCHFYDDYFLVHAGIKNGEPDYFIRDDFINSKELYHGKKVIFGHTAFKKPYVDKYKIGIDTGAVYPDMGLLTAYNLDTGEFVYHDGRKELLTNESL
jgi:serine/threonine protein phosphatase 1